MEENQEPKDSTEVKPAPLPGAHTLANDIEKAKSGNKIRALIASGTNSMRTLSSDFSSAFVGKKGNAIKVMLEEEQEKAETPAEDKKQNIFFTVASILFVILGLSFIVFLTIKKNNQIVPPTNNIVFPIYILTDGNTAVPLQSGDKTASIKSLHDVFDAFDQTQTIAGIYPTVGTPPKLLSLTDFTKAIGLTVPPEVLTSFVPTFMLGAEKVSPNVEPFILLKAPSYDSAAHAMLTWEPTLYKTVTAFLPITEELSLFDQPFTNAIVKNKDARVLRNADGTIIFLYTFIDNNTLLITTNTEVVGTVIERLNLQR